MKTTAKRIGAAIALLGITASLAGCGSGTTNTVEPGVANTNTDQTEFNNAMLIADMLYDLIDLIHRNSFNFNEPEDVELMQSLVSTTINTSYAPHAASLTTTVSKLGTTGKDKYTTRIVVPVNLKDINKYAIVDFILTDE